MFSRLQKNLHVCEILFFGDLDLHKYPVPLISFLKIPDTVCSWLFVESSVSLFSLSLIANRLSQNRISGIVLIIVKGNDRCFLLFFPCVINNPIILIICNMNNRIVKYIIGGIEVHYTRPFRNHTILIPVRSTLL